MENFSKEKLEKTLFDWLFKTGITGNDNVEKQDVQVNTQKLLNIKEEETETVKISKESKQTLETNSLNIKTNNEIIKLIEDNNNDNSSEKESDKKVIINNKKDESKVFRPKKFYDEEEYDKDDPIDIKYIYRDKKTKSHAVINEMKAECILSRHQKKPDLKMKGWYVLVPKESYLRNPLYESSQREDAFYFPDCRSIDEVFSIIQENITFSIYQNWIGIIKLETAEEKVYFIGGKDQDEPPCPKHENSEHNWDIEYYVHDMVYYEEGVCLDCGMKSILIKDDTVGYKWNKNHGIRYLTNDGYPIRPKKS